MASFDESTPVLRFAAQDGSEGQPWRWVLWPALAWRVVAPSPRRRELNVIQRAVLGFLRADVSDLQRIATGLRLGRELVALIVSEAQARGWADSRGGLTPEGLKTLESDEADPIEEATVGWIFTDAADGGVFQRFMTGQLPYAEVDFDAARHRRLVGSRGSGRHQGTYTFIPPSTVLQRPDARAIVRAARAGHERQRRLSDLPEGVAVERVSFVSTEAEAFYLAARVRRTPGAEWVVDDPVGAGQSALMRRRIADRLDQPGLRAWLEPVIGGSSEDRDFSTLRTRAEFTIESQLTSAVRRWDEVWDRLVTMQRALFETEEPDCPGDKLDDVSVKAQRAAERVFLQVNADHPLFARELMRDRDTHEQLITEIALDLGFGPPPKSLVRVQSGKIQAAIEAGGSLRPLTLAALLVARRVPEHPLRRAARHVPDLLARIDALAAVRDRSAHESVRPSKHTVRSRQIAASESVQTAIDLAHHLLVSRS